MNQDKGKDDHLFNCSQKHEIEYVAGRYVQKEIVKAFLEEKCKDKTIWHCTHRQVYALILSELGFPVPVSYNK